MRPQCRNHGLFVIAKSSAFFFLHEQESDEAVRVFYFEFFSEQIKLLYTSPFKNLLLYKHESSLICNGHLILSLCILGSQFLMTFFISNSFIRAAILHCFLTILGNAFWVIVLILSVENLMSSASNSNLIVSVHTVHLKC